MMGETGAFTLRSLWRLFLLSSCCCGQSLKSAEPAWCLRCHLSIQLYTAPKRLFERVHCTSLTVRVDNATRVKLRQVRPHNVQDTHERLLTLVLQEAEENRVRDAVDDRVDRVKCRESIWDNAVRPVGKELGCNRRLEPHVCGGEDQDPRRCVHLVLVAVKNQERVVGVFWGDWRCSDPQTLRDDESARTRHSFQSVSDRFPTISTQNIFFAHASWNCSPYIASRLLCAFVILVMTSNIGKCSLTAPMFKSRTRRPRAL